MPNFCPECGAKLSFPEAIFCPNCGYILRIESTSKAETMSIGDSTTRTYALVGFIFYMISLTSTTAMFFMILLPPFSFLLRFFNVPFFLLGVIIGGGLTVWAWVTLRRIKTGRGSEARTSSLILGILGLYFGLLIGGIFFLLAYTRLEKGAAKKTSQHKS